MEKIREQPDIEVEKKEKEPEISYHFFYSPHRTAKDFENLEKAFKEADIYIPEMAFWFSSLPDILQSVSNGQIPLRMAEMIFGVSGKSAQHRELEIICDSKKPILLADVSAVDKKLVEKFEVIVQLDRQAIDFFKQGNFKKSLQRARSSVEKEVQFHLEREAKIKENLKNQITKFLNDNPKYKEKERIKVLIKLGSFHTKIYQDMKKEGLSVSREFKQLPFVYSFFDEAHRRIIFNNKKVDDELLARGIIGQFIYSIIKDLTDDTNKLFWLVRKLASQLTFKDIERISKDFSQNPNLDIIEELDKFNIKVPKSEKEIDEILDTK